MEYNSQKTCSQDIRRNKAVSYFKEYCDITGIHGFRYIVEDRTIYERIWWIIALSLSIIFSGLMIYQIIQKYIYYPVIVTFSMQEEHINRIPFPAVTICPRSKISHDYFNITEATIQKIRNESFHGESERMYNIASTICDFYATEDSNNNTRYEDVYEFLNRSMTSNFQYCSYTAGIDCAGSFTPILTEEGVCYSFNILDKKLIFRDNVYTLPGFHKTRDTLDWDNEEGYSQSKQLLTYPLRAMRPGSKNGLFVVLQTKRSDIEYDCSSDESGYRVAIHLPSNIPEVTDSYFTVPLNQRVTGQIVPSLIKTSAGVKMFDPTKRDCYFQSERTLKFFKIYTQENCLIECKANFILELCNCVGFYMPRYKDTPVCILEDIKCMELAEANFTIFYINSQMTDQPEVKSEVNCDCLPTCTDLTYSLEISQNNFMYKPRDSSFQLDEGYEYSILNLYFKSSHIETKERNELYGFSDFISNFGGLLGLFTGFSMLSFIEIIYFLTLRIWGNIKLHRNWSGKIN
ncbi:hypothetical protein NQ315_005861 [Exocentrus adspersus]|uniref:Uncharacterized protein n=1 Tax=Exocentrus adspersus TaxID=1586481 RepID=A0AAV8VRJ4_9CUCU|nr:hypothetical protein NQ315_005861 [Exocentrus adspersus]